MNNTLWRNRISNRTDLVARLTHLTRADSDQYAFEKLWKIIIEKRLIGSDNSGYIVGNRKAVCFQEVPLYSIVENLLFEESMKENIRYSWFGLRFNKIAMYNMGARPVFYGRTEELKKILTNDIIDWSHEREWRILDECRFEYNDVEVIVKDDNYYAKFVNRCLDENRKDILTGVHGIIPLNTVIS